MRPAWLAVRCPYSRARAASVSAKVDSHTTMSAPSASSKAASHSRVSMMNANRWPGLGSLTWSSVTRRSGLHTERGGPHHQPCFGWAFPQVHRVAEHRRMPQPGEYLLVLSRIAGLHRVRYPIQGHPREHARQAQAVISVEMRDADPGDPARRDPGEQHLPLCPLTRVEQQSLVIPQQQVTIVVA